MPFPHLNPQQQRAVEAIEGRVLILAGAGSGKTSVLIHRIAYLLRHPHIDPSHVLALTFTNKAAREMRGRIATLVPRAQAQALMLSTFHSFCLFILRKEIHRLGYTPEFTLVSEQQTRRLVKFLAEPLLEGEPPPQKKGAQRVSAAQGAPDVSKAQKEAPSPLSLDTLMEQIAQARARSSQASELMPPETRQLMEQLEIAMRAHNALDFDALLTLTVRLFEQFPSVLESYQERFRYIMIDEYQDTNPIQYRLAELLSQKRGNLCVVGDDDQAIYSWRGADVRNILRFPATTTIKLEQNYRSTPQILKASNALIAHNRERHAKELWSSVRDAQPIELFYAPDEKLEVDAVLQRVVALQKREKLPWSEIAILYRSNLLSRPFELALMQTTWHDGESWRRGIPYQVFGGIEFYERSEVKDLFAYLRVIANPLDQEALLRIINVPRRGISENALDLLTQMNRQKGIALWEVLTREPISLLLSERATRGVQQFVTLIDEARSRFQRGHFQSAAHWLVESIDYKRAIEEEIKSDKARDIKWENVLAMIDALGQFDREEAAEGSLASFLSSMVVDPFGDKQRQRSGHLNLMTFHSAKGLEFEACFLVALEEQIVPHERSLKEGALEEERRLLYVAMTRAKKQLTLSMAQTRKRYGKEAPCQPSRFLFEIPKGYFNLVPWQVGEA